jgi:hypothetical protein
MLITQTEVIDLAFAIAIDTSAIKDSVIQSAELGYIRPILTPVLYEAVLIDPGHYGILLSTYIKPCQAFYVKYLVYNSLFTEKNEGKTLIDPTYSITNFPEIRQDTVQDALKTAQNYEAAMVDFLVAQNYPGYNPPVDPPAPDTGRLKCGFYIQIIF